VLVALLGTAVLPASDSSAEATFERTLSVSGPVELDVATGSGSIAIRPGDSATVRILGTVRARRSARGDADQRVRSVTANPPIEQAGNSIRIRQIDEGNWRDNQISVSYEIAVPRETRLRARTGSGSQTLEGIRGPADIGTGSGSLKIRDVGDTVRAETGSGSVEVADLRADARVNTGSGSISARGIARDFSASTGSGRILLDGATGVINLGTGSGSIEVGAIKGSLKVSTGSGSITAAGDPTGEWKLDSGSGTIRVRLPAQAAFDLDAHGSGGISINHPLTVRGKVSRDELAGSVRGGGPLVRLHTSSGTIHIE
jgi:DUF4097 and DUF4098 domain-containing protein YvlB